MSRQWRGALVGVVLGGLLGWVPAATGQGGNLPSQPVPVLPPAGGSGGAPVSGPEAGADIAVPPLQPVPVSPGAPPYVAPPGPYVAPPLPPPVDVGPPPIVVHHYDPVGIWFDMDYLLWWSKASHVPALTTAAVPPDAGVIGPANSATFFNGGDADAGARSGGRFSLGFWFSENQVLGLEGTYFFLAQHSIPLASGEEASSQAGAPNGFDHIALSTNLQSAEFNLIANLGGTGRLRYGLLGGFRFLQLDENLHVQQSFVSSDFTEQDVWDDNFRTQNHFYGGQLGGRIEYVYERLVFDLVGKVALGATDQKVALGGGVTQAISTPSVDQFGNPIVNVQVNQSVNGGLLTQPALFHRDYFTVVPEVGFTLGYQLTNWVRASAGYTFIYWSSVVRPGDQVTGVPKATGYWAQGLNLGLSFRF
jgi:hypothetical protein